MGWCFVLAKSQRVDTGFRLGDCRRKGGRHTSITTAVFGNNLVTALALCTVDDYIVTMGAMSP